jgi:hypothetical protein
MAIERPYFSLLLGLVPCRGVCWGASAKRADSGVRKLTRKTGVPTRLVVVINVVPLVEAPLVLLLRKGSFLLIRRELIR